MDKLKQPPMESLNACHGTQDKGRAPGCRFCGKTLATKHLVRVHERRHRLARVKGVPAECNQKRAAAHLCSPCGINFLTMEAQARHVARNHIKLICKDALSK